MAVVIRAQCVRPRPHRNSHTRAHRHTATYQYATADCYGHSLSYEHTGTHVDASAYLDPGAYQHAAAYELASPHEYTTPYLHPGSSGTASRVAPGGAIFINCGPGEPCIDLHSSHTDISVDELAVLSFSIVNSLGKPAMLSRLILELPSGWSMDGEGFADKCSGLCSANYSIPTGEQEFIEVSAYPNHSGNFRLSGRIEWVYAGTDNILHLSRDVQIKVTAGASGNENRVQPLPTSPPRPPTAAPAAASPQQQPTAPPVGGTGPGGCNAPPPDARVLDPGLLLLAGLLFPGIAIRGIWKWKRGSSSSP